MKTLAQAVALALLVTWSYLPCLHGTWLWDDGLEIAHNPVLRDPSGWWTAWIHPVGMDYFPLKSSLQWVEWHAWGARPLGYHCANLGLHILSSLLVWRLLSALGVRAGYVGGLIFALHPLAVESVAWISEFKNTVSLPPLLLASIAYVEFDRDRRRRSWVLALLWFLAALACKTSVVMFPVVLLLFAVWRRGRVSARDLRETSPFFAASLVMGTVTTYFQSRRAIGISGTGDALPTRIAQAGWSLAAYARQSLWPSHLAPVYAPTGGGAAALLPWMGVAAVGVLIWLNRSGWGRAALLGWGWFFLNLVPVLGLVPMAYSRISPRADHFAYVSLVGVAGWAAACYGRGVESGLRAGTFVSSARALCALILGAVLAGFAFESHSYAAVFTDERTLWSYAIAREPGAWLARNNLGTALLEEGKPLKASVHLREAVRLRPDSAEARANLGSALDALGQADQARAAFEAALRIDPGFAGARYDLGLSLLRSADNASAADEFKKALVLNPAHASARNNLGLALARMGGLVEATDQYRRALELDPGLQEAHLNLGNVFFRQGRMEEAVGEYRAALRIDPAYLAAHNNLAQALARLGRENEARAELEAGRRPALH